MLPALLSAILGIFWEFFQNTHDPLHSASIGDEPTCRFPKTLRVQRQSPDQTISQHTFVTYPSPTQQKHSRKEDRTHHSVYTNMAGMEIQSAEQAEAFVAKVS